MEHTEPSEEAAVSESEALFLASSLEALMRTALPESEWNDDREVKLCVDETLLRIFTLNFFGHAMTPEQFGSFVDAHVTSNPCVIWELWDQEDPRLRSVLRSHNPFAMVDIQLGNLTENSPTQGDTQ